MIADCDVINFEINLFFLVKPFLLYDQKVKTNTEIPCQQKELLRKNKKPFSSFLKGYHTNNYKKFFWKVTVRL